MKVYTHIYFIVLHVIAFINNLCNYITDIKCLQNALQDSNKPLQPDCFKMLTTRMEMFRNAAKVCCQKYLYLFFFLSWYNPILFVVLQLIAPNSFEELYSSVNHSPARRYFMVVGFTLIGIIFIVGMFCGRVTRRTMIMKNK